MSNLNRQSFAVSLTGRIVAAILVAAVCCGLLAGFATATYSLNIFADGKIIPVKTASRNPQRIVEQANLAITEDDKIDTSSFHIGKEIEDGNALIVYRAVPVTIYEDGKKLASVKAAGMVSDAVEKAGIQLEGADTTNYDPETLLKKNMKIEVLRAYVIKLKVDGTTRKIDYAKGTVKEVLERENVTLGEFDVVKPGLDETLKPGSVIKIKRVTYETRQVEKVKKYSTIEKTSSVLAAGVERVARQGQNGSVIITYEDKYVDGKLKSSKKVEETIQRKPVDKVVVKGTRTSASSSNTLSTNSKGAPTSYVKTFHGPATAYTAKAGALTASGAVAKRGLVAVNPKQIPYGSKLYIVADDGSVYGYCTAADTGGFVTNGSGTLVDLYMDTNAECIQWGRRNVTIYVISWGNGRV